MANLSLPQLFEHIEQFIKNKFPQFVEVQAFPENREDLKTPAFYFEVVDVQDEPDDDPQTGQSAHTLRFEGHVVCKFKGAHAKRDAFALAMAVATALRRTRFDIPPGPVVGPAEVIGVSKDSFNPHLDQYHTWTVEWSQLVFLGDDAWEEGGTTPTQVLFSSAPLIGPAHVDDYEPI